MGKVDPCQSLLNEICLWDPKPRPVSVKVRNAFRSQERDLPGSLTNPGFTEDLEQRWWLWQWVGVGGLWAVGKGRGSGLARWKPTLQPSREQALRVLGT